VGFITHRGVWFLVMLIGGGSETAVVADGRRKGQKNKKKTGQWPRPNKELKGETRLITALHQEDPGNHKRNLQGKGQGRTVRWIRVGDLITSSELEDNQKEDNIV